MNLVFLGPPGAGKGTMATRLADDLDIPHISTGDIFRNAVKKQTELGKKVKPILDRGDLVPDELTIQLVEERLISPDTKEGYILDGFPRTVPQAEALDEFAAIDHAVNFKLPDEEAIKRLSGRRIAPSTGKTYHVIFNPPKREGIDDETGEKLVTRPDDQVDAVKNRLDVYKKMSAPLIEYYNKKGNLMDVDASPSPDDVYSQLKEKLKV